MRSGTRLPARPHARCLAEKTAGTATSRTCHAAARSTSVCLAHLSLSLSLFLCLFVCLSVAVSLLHCVYTYTYMHAYTDTHTPTQVYFPVFVEGANLSMGDMHFSQVPDSL